MNTVRLREVSGILRGEYRVIIKLIIFVQDWRLWSLAANDFGRVGAEGTKGVARNDYRPPGRMKGCWRDICSELLAPSLFPRFTFRGQDMDIDHRRIIKKTTRDHDCVIITPEKLYDFIDNGSR